LYIAEDGYARKQQEQPQSLMGARIDMTNDRKVPTDKRDFRRRLILTTLGLIPIAIVISPFLRGRGSTKSGRATLLAVNQGDATLGIVDPRAGRQIAAIAEGGVTGHEVATSFDGKLAYIPIYGDSSVGEPGTDGKEIGRD
jgi:hypothetical protein